MIHNCSVRCIWVLVALLLSVSFAQTALADPANIVETNKAIAEVLFKKGASVGKIVISSVKHQNQLDALPANSPEADLSAISIQYQQQVESASFAVEQLTLTRDLIGIGVAGTMTATGVGAVPGVVVKMAWNAATDYGLNALSKDMNDKLSAFLAKNVDKWTATIGLNPNDDWSKIPASELRERLEKAEGPLANLKKDMVGNPDGYRIASDAVVKTIQKTNYAVLDQLSKQGAAIEGAQEKLAKQGKDIADFKNFATKELQKQSDKIVNLTKDMNDTRDALGRLETGMASNTAQTRAVAEVLFANMSPREKLAALEGPLVQHMSGPTRDDLKKVLLGEVRKQETFESFTKVVSNLASVHAIAANLGIKSPELSKAVQISMVAQSAVSQVMTGNYLGAVVAVTGLFGSQTDPAAERHQQLMSYLKEAFAEVNAKLDQILENQKKMMGAIVGLSEQMSEYNRALHQRLDRMEFEQKRILDGVQQSLWQPYLSCSNAYQYSAMTWIDPRDAKQKYARFDRDLSFENFAHLEHVRDNSGNHIHNCIELAANFWSGTKNDSMFGQLLALKSVRNATAQVVDGMSKPDQAKLKADKQYYVPEDIQIYMSDLYLPTLELVLADAASASPIGPRGIAHLLISSLAPSRTLSSYRTKLEKIKGKSAKLCGSETALTGRWYELLCEWQFIDPPKAAAPSTPATEAEAGLRLVRVLREPLSADVLEQVHEWTTFAAAYADWISPVTNTLMKPEEVLKSPHRGRGRDLIHGNLGITDIAIAQYALIYGDATSRIVFSKLWDESKNAFAPLDTPDRKAAHVLLMLNPYLARNVLMWALDAASARSGFGGAANYRFALEMLQSSGAANSIDSLRVLVGDGNLEFPSKLWAFSLNEDEKRGYFVWDFLKVPLPTVEEFRDRRLVYPSRLTRLENWRARLAEKYADYLVFQRFSVDQTSQLVRYMKD